MDLTNVDLRAIQWRHHGLGMLQGELTEARRIHIWHPSLVTLPERGFRRVHDHRFRLCSRVLYGEIRDASFEVTFSPAEPNTNCWEIKHAKVQDGNDVVYLGPVHCRQIASAIIPSGHEYTVGPRLFHTTETRGLTITVVDRSDFDDRPARVLGEAAHSAIIRYPDEDPARVTHEKMIATIVDMARAALGSR